jgi:hypothetical protein
MLDYRDVDRKQIRLKNEADCLDPQHTELRSGPLRNLPRWPKPSTARAVSFVGHKETVIRRVARTFKWRLPASKQPFDRRRQHPRASNSLP